MEAKLIECELCGKKISSLSKNCIGCGHPVQEIEIETKKCSLCNAPMLINCEICKECGQPFALTEVTIQEVEKHVELVKEQISEAVEKGRKYICVFVTSLGESKDKVKDLFKESFLSFGIAGREGKENCYVVCSYGNDLEFQKIEVEGGKKQFKQLQSEKINISFDSIENCELDKRVRGLGYSALTIVDSMIMAKKDKEFPRYLVKLNNGMVYSLTIPIEKHQIEMLGKEMYNGELNAFVEKLKLKIK